jgi:NAD-dependent histone deacetylase SIR2
MTDINEASDTCTPEESSRLRRELREHGPAVFCQRTVDCGRYSAKKLLTAFAIKPPTFLEGEADDAYFSLLSLAISRELSKRVKLGTYNSVDDAVDLIQRCKNIIVITGAGISTSLGIPDFRSKGTGLYSKLEHLGLNDPQEVFDIDVFKQDPTIFYSVAKDIVPATDRYTPTHKFIAMLHQRGKLLTNYSQNIDNLEVKAGLPKDKLVQCHGSFGTASCVQCGYQINGETIFPDIKAGNIPRCPRCTQSLRENSRSSSSKRKRSAASDSKRRNRRWSAADNSSDNDSDYDIPEAGVMKPDITFFGEALPDEFSRRLTEHDRDKVDLVVVIGTSLKVTPVSEIVSWLPATVPQIYVSRQSVNHINFDIDLLGDCDVVVTELCRRLAWPFTHEMVPSDQVISVTEEPGSESRHVFSVDAKSPSA